MTTSYQINCFGIIIYYDFFNIAIESLREKRFISLCSVSEVRMLVTLLYDLKNRELKRGLATLCLGGGNPVAMIVER